MSDQPTTPQVEVRKEAWQRKADEIQSEVMGVAIANLPNTDAEGYRECYNYSEREIAQMIAADRKEREQEYMGVQACPVCGGQKTVSKPPWVAGDIHQWESSTATNTYPCPTCNATGLVPIQRISIKES